MHTPRRRQGLLLIPPKYKQDNNGKVRGKVQSAKSP